MRGKIEPRGCYRLKCECVTARVRCKQRPGWSMPRYITCNENQPDTLFMVSSVYFVNQLLHVSAIFVAHHQEVYCTYTTIGTCCAF